MTRPGRLPTPTTTGASRSGSWSRRRCSTSAPGSSWVRTDVRDAVHQIIQLPVDRMVRTIVQLGITDGGGAGTQEGPGKARLPREETVFRDRWPAG